MDAALNFLQPYDLHPVVDHFTVALLMVGVLVDLVGSLFPLRSWIRYMALTLMILGAIAAGASYLTGGVEADRVWNSLGEPAKTVLGRHAEWAEYTAIAFGILAIWRLLIESIGALAGSRPLYLIFAVIGACVLGYVGHLGGKLVYTYGVGTDLLAAQASPTPTAAPSPSNFMPTSLPTVSIPTSLPSGIPPALVPLLPTAIPTPKAADSPSPTPSASSTADGV
jgi:uncharacterized membrane protein